MKLYRTLSLVGRTLCRLLPCLVLVGLLASLSAPSSALAQEKVAFRDDFNDLSGWEPKSFPGSDDSTFEVQQSPDGNWLVVTSDASNSAILASKPFNINEFPRMRWRWLVENLYEGGDLTKDGADDSPIRIWVLFENGPKLSFMDQMQYAMLKTFIGPAAPRSTLIYTWANKTHPERITPDWETDRMMLVFQEEGPEKLGQWVEEDVDLLADYRAAYGMDPSTNARIMINGDANDLKQRARVLIDYVEIYRPAELTPQDRLDALSEQFGIETEKPAEKPAEQGQTATDQAGQEKVVQPGAVVLPSGEAGNATPEVEPKVGSGAEPEQGGAAGDATEGSPTTPSS